MNIRASLLLALVGGVLSGADRDVTGRVVDSQSDAPVARARVTLHFFQAGTQGLELTLLSDADGSFSVTNMPEGGYQISCQKAGYLSDFRSIAAPSATAAGQSPPPVVIRLTAQAALEGTIVDDRDMPAPFTSVQLLRQQAVNGHRQYQTAAGAATDESGYFRIFELPAGRYYVAVSARVSDPARAKSRAYPTLFYPNSTELAAAQPFDLKAGDEQRIQMRLPEPLPAREVRGTIATASTNVGLMLTREPAGQIPISSDNRWDAKTQTFRLQHVLPGMYQLTATVFDGTNALRAGATFTVGDSDVTGIRLQPQESAVDGTVRVEGPAAQPRPIQYISFQSPRFSNGTQVDADGKFHAMNLAPDRYRVIPQVNNQLCVRSILQDGRDVRDQLVVSAEAPTAPVEIVLSSHCGSVDVTLAPSDSPRQPNLGAMLLRKAGDEMVLEKQGFLGSPRVTIQGVTPGDYMLYVWPQEAQIEYANPEYMRQFESYGKAVTVTEDGKVSVTVDKVVVLPAKN